jgi:hypothetical protein
MLKRSPVLKVIAALTLFLAADLPAGPLQKQQVPAAAKWAVHANVEAFLASKTGDFALQELKKRGFDEALTNIQNAFAFDPTKDLKSVTVYGLRFGDHAAVILIHGTMDRDRLTEVVRSNETYKELKYGTHTVHQWTDNPQAVEPGPTKFGSFHGDGLLVLTEDVRLHEQALDVLDRKADSLAGPGASGFLPAASEGSFLTAYVKELPSIGKGRPEAAILGKLASGSLQVAESSGRLSAHLAVTARTARTAGNLRKVAEGFLALMDLAGPEQEGQAPAGAEDRVLFGDTAVPAKLVAVLKDVKVTSTGRTVKVDATAPVSNAISLLRWVIDKQTGAGEAATSDDEKSAGKAAGSP